MIASGFVEVPHDHFAHIAIRLIKLSWRRIPEPFRYLANAGRGLLLRSQAKYFANLVRRSQGQRRRRPCLAASARAAASGSAMAPVTRDVSGILNSWHIRSSRSTRAVDAPLYQL